MILLMQIYGPPLVDIGDNSQISRFLLGGNAPDLAEDSILGSVMLLAGYIVVIKCRATGLAFDGRGNLQMNNRMVLGIRSPISIDCIGLTAHPSRMMEWLSFKPRGGRRGGRVKVRTDFG